VAARIKTAIQRANGRLAELRIEPLSERVTPHSLRRTYASMRFALGDDPLHVAEQLGHTEATFSMEVYAKAAKRRGRLSGAYGPSTTGRSNGQGMGRERGRGATLDRPADAVAAPEMASQSQNLHTGPDSSAG
jgi:hypothetical protein